MSALKRWCLTGTTAAALLVCGWAAGAPLPKGVAVLPEDSAGAFALQGEPGSATLETVAVEDRPFARALRVRTLRRPQHPYSVQLQARNVAPVRAGDVLLATFWLRCIEPAGGPAHTAFIFELARSPWTKSAQYAADATATWREVHVPFQSRGTYAPGQASINFHAGFAPQVIEIGGISVTNYGRAVRLRDLPRTKSTYAGREAGAAWRKAAAQRIETLRKGDMTVVVTDAAGGAPVAGAEVRARMVRHAFGFGSAVAAAPLVAQTDEGRRYRQTVKRLFSKVVFENDLKWFGWEDRRRRKDMFQALAWLEGQGIAVRGHCLVWPSWRQTPRDLRDLRDRPEALRRRIDQHVREEVGALKGRICEWDVINEPYSNHDLMDVLGNQAMVEWFQAAHQADPKAELFLNDYSILTGGGLDTPHQEHYLKTLRFLLDHGAPLQAIGLQGHFSEQVTPPEKLLEVLDRFAALRLPLQVTEFDINTTDEELQADYTRDFMTVLFSHPGVKGILMWGFWAGRHWRPNAALFGRDWSLRPHGKVWTDLVLGEWWTDGRGRTDAAGRWGVRGFLGAYDVTVRAGGRTRTVRAALPKAGAEVAVKME